MTVSRGEDAMAEAGHRMRRLAAKTARRKAVVAAKKKADPSARGLGERIRIASSCPIARCLLPAGLFETGIGHIIIARSLPSGLLGCGFFLIDPFCLGVKDAFYSEIGHDELQSRIDAQSEFQTFADANPSLARKLISDSVTYADELGLAPHKDYRLVDAIFGSIDANSCTETFTFGKNGKPFYVTGPLDTPTRKRIICATLQERFGTGGWDYLVDISGV